MNDIIYIELNNWTPDEDGDVYGRWGTLFAEYCDENIGLIDVDSD